ncbi:MAG: D-sedoheptulose 7-phosphate isomerase [Bacteroidota bacterium]|nr:D-sedoheptulose 7-phosphate isomerase [Bacteroidota bacterium]MDP4224961.1 D-sedoheptulose 7-phosphate isomerase [Bacteroidota bacterium]MDP4274117.1 D-sedoheptulose 7-phosphate isomerase [Bacteroidota bacterium]
MAKDIEEIKKNFEDAQKVLKIFMEDGKNWEAFEKAGDAMVEAIKEGKKIISCGNGGSMSDAMHFAEELTGRFRDERPSFSAIAISDPAHITCVANDYGFDYVFSRYIEGVGKKGDVLLAISTSGNSKNIVQAAMAAKEKGMTVVALTGKTGGKLATLCNFELRAPLSKYSDRVQEIHIKLIHSLIHYIEMGME